MRKSLQEMTERELAKTAQDLGAYIEVAERLTRGWGRDPKTNPDRIADRDKLQALRAEIQRRSDR